MVSSLHAIWVSGRLRLRRRSNDGDLKNCFDERHRRQGATRAFRRRPAGWLGRKDSNPRMPESKSGALTSLATPQRETSAPAVGPRRPNRVRGEHHHAASGNSDKLCTAQPRHAAGNPLTASCAALSLATTAKTAEPEPVIRAAPKRAKWTTAASTSANRVRTTGSRSLAPNSCAGASWPPKPADSCNAEKAEIVSRFVQRVNSGAE